MYQKAIHPMNHDKVLNNMRKWTDLKRLYHGFLVHFVVDGSYASLLAIMNLEKLPVNAGQNHSFVSNKRSPKHYIKRQKAVKINFCKLQG